MTSLQDQLLKAGLINKKQAKQAVKHNKQQARKARKGEVTDSDTHSRVKQQQVLQAQRSRQLNAANQAHQHARELQYQARQMIMTGRINTDTGTLTYHFTHNNKIKQLCVTKLQQDSLSRGHLAIVELEQQYHLLPAALAERIQQRLPEIFVARTTVQSESVADDPYADYVIPDDLMW